MALDFDGTDDEVDFGDVVDKADTDAFSVDYWTKTETGTGTAVGTYIGKANRDLPTAGDFRGWFFEYDDSNDRTQGFLIHDNDADPRERIFVKFSGVAAIIGNEWAHMAWTYDGSGLASGVSHYIDGVQRTLNATNDNLTGTMSTTAALHLGRVDSDEREFDGAMQFVRIWNVELTAAQVATLMHRPRHVDERVDLAVMLDEQSGTTAHDLRQVNDGTITGATWAEGPPVTPLIDGGVV